MADITRLTRLLNGVLRGVDISSNTLVVSSIKIGASQYEITNAIAAKLVKITSVADGDSGADAVSATAVGAGSAVTVQGIMEELDSAIGALTHDGFSDFVAKEHIDWTADAGADNINDANIIASNITQHVASIDHDSLLNFVAAEHIDWSVTGAEDVHADRIGASAITQHVASIDHDSLLNFASAEHIDWTADAGASNINDANILASSITQHVASIDHDSLLNFASAEHVDWATASQGTIDVTNLPSAVLVEGDIIDTLVSTSTTAPLSANQGKALKDLVDGLSSGLFYAGSIDVTSDVNMRTDGQFPTNFGKGDFYKISAGSANLTDGTNTIAVNAGDMIIVNVAVAKASIDLSTDVDKIDNTEASDILREGDLTDGKIFIGNVSNIATAVSTSGDVSLSNAGVFAIASGVIVNDDINASAAIAYSKLALSNSILNADINASAAIAYSKLALSGSILNADINASAAIVESKLALDYGTSGLNTAITNHTGSSSNPHSVTKAQVLAAELIVNTDVKSDAAIAYSKLALSGSILNADINASAAIATSKLADASAIGESVTFFGSTDLSAAEAEQLSDGSNADSLHAHAIFKKAMVAGESFAANTVFAVRMALNGETDTRVYKADKDASVSDKFHVIGLVYPTGAVAAGESIEVIMLGEILSSVVFTASQDEGKPVFLSSAGVLTLTPPTTADEAVMKVGNVSKVGAAATAKIMVAGIQLMGIN